MASHRAAPLHGDQLSRSQRSLSSRRPAFNNVVCCCNHQRKLLPVSQGQTDDIGIRTALLPCSNPPRMRTSCAQARRMPLFDRFVSSAWIDCLSLRRHTARAQEIYPHTSLFPLKVRRHAPVWTCSYLRL